VRAFFDQPVSNGLQFVEAGTGPGVELQHLLLAAPEGLHAGQAVENEMNVSR